MTRAPRLAATLAALTLAGPARATPDQLYLHRTDEVWKRIQDRWPQGRLLDTAGKRIELLWWHTKATYDEARPQAALMSYDRAVPELPPGYTHGLRSAAPYFESRLLGLPTRYCQVDGSTPESEALWHRLNEAIRRGEDLLKEVVNLAHRVRRDRGELPLRTRIHLAEARGHEGRIRNLRPVRIRESALDRYLFQVPKDPDPIAPARRFNPHRWWEEFEQIQGLSELDPLDLVRRRKTIEKNLHDLRHYAREDLPACAFYEAGPYRHLRQARVLDRR